MSVLRKIYNKANWKLLLISIVLFGLFMVGVLPYISSLTEQYGSGPDTMFDFGLGSYYEARIRYGIDGRRLYIILRWTFDVVWPMVYTFFYFMAIGYIAKKIDDKVGYKWMIIPVIAVALDFLENTIATIFMASFPKDVDVVVYSLMVSSMLKWLFISITMLLILYLIIRRAVQLIGKNRK
mgnify:CR=1 FL=1